MPRTEIERIEFGKWRVIDCYGEIKPDDTGPIMHDMGRDELNTLARQIDATLQDDDLANHVDHETDNRKEGGPF